MRILFITNTPPIPTWGGAMAFYRHFCERRDFDIHVITDNPQILGYEVPYSYLLISKSKFVLRLSRTRFYKAVHTWSSLAGYLKLPDRVLQQSKEFKPDAVLTVAGSWSWMAIMAKDVARRLNAPLIGSFNDWWYYNTIRYSWMDKILEKKFRKFYGDCDLALCTSEGMQAALGPHKNAIVFYPTGALMSPHRQENAMVNEGFSFTIAFGGNIGEWYGRMLERLVTESPDTIKFSIYGSNPSWSSGFDARVRKEGIYHGQVSFETLQREMKKQNALLLLMGFERESYQIEKTSFKTKFLDYLSFQKPILLWGPDYCSAVAMARKFDSAEICTSPLASDFLITINKLRSDKRRQQELITNANRMYEEKFHPDKIHQLLTASVSDLINNHR